MPVVNLTRRGIAALPSVNRRTIFFDKDVAGFGLRVSPPLGRQPGNRAWIVEYRPNGGGRGVSTRRMVLGTWQELSPEKARKAAKDLLADVRRGADPMAEKQAARRAATVEQLIRAYLDEEIAPKRKPRTLELYESYLRNHIAPRTNDEDKRLLPGAFGGKKAVNVTRADVARLHREIGEAQRMTANRCVVLISAAFNWGAKHGALKEDHKNPASGVTKYPENRRERFLTAAEFARLGESLRLAETEGLPWHPDPEKPKANRAAKEENRRVVFDQYAVGAIRLLIFTGCRLREILMLRWSDVDTERGMLFLPDSKTGRKSVVLSAPALEVLASLDRVGVYVIAGESAGAEEEKPRADLHRPWSRITKHAKLPGVRIHDLRHSFASVGAAGGLGLPIVGGLLGHKDTATTARYAHLADDPLRRGADAIAKTIKGAMSGHSASIVPLQKEA